jgi:hypothetical protein
MEDDNSGGRDKWQFASSQTVDGRAFRSGDEITIEVDFADDTVTIYRNKDKDGEAKFVKQGIPFAGPVHFALTLYNTDAKAEILDSTISVDAGTSTTVVGTSAEEEGVTDADREQLSELCEITELILQVPDLQKEVNADGHTPTAMILNMTSGRAAPRKPWNPVGAYTLDYASEKSSTDQDVAKPTDFKVNVDGWSGVVFVGDQRVTFKRGPPTPSAEGEWDVELFVDYVSAGVQAHNMVYHINTAASMCVFEIEGDVVGSAGYALCSATTAPKNAANESFGSSEIARYFFDKKDSFLSLFSDAQASLGSTYDVLSGALFSTVMRTLQDQDLQSKALESFVRGSAIIYTQCFAQNLDIKTHTKLDPVGDQLRQNIKEVFASFPVLATLELGECARALAMPLINNSVLPLKLTMLKANKSTVIKRPQSCNVAGTMRKLLAGGDAGSSIAAPLFAMVKRGARQQLATEVVVLPDIDSIKTSTGGTLLHLAVAEKQLEIAQILIKHGSNVNATDADGHTALGRAVLDGNVPCVAMLLQHPAMQPNHTTNDDGVTPLHLACSGKLGSIEIVSLLLQGGAGSTVSKTVSGATARDTAQRHGHTECAKLLDLWPKSITAAGNDKTGEAAVVCTEAVRVLRPFVSKQALNANTSAGSEAAAVAIADGKTFGTWARRLPNGSKTTTSSDISMAENLALSVGRLLKELIRVYQTVPTCLDDEDPYDNPTRQVFLSVTDSIWRFAAEEMDYLEAHLRAGTKHLNRKAGDNNPVSAPKTAAAMANMYTAALLDSHHNGIIGAVPCVDVAAYGHIAILADALLHALPVLHVGNAGADNDDESLLIPAGRTSASSPFFLRSDSVEPYATIGGDMEELKLINSDVKTALPLASNPYLLMEPRNVQFGNFEISDVDGSSGTHAVERHSGRLSPQQLPSIVSGNKPARQWSGSDDSDTLPSHSWDTMVDFEAETALLSIFQVRWRTSIELMGTEFQKFFSEGEDEGFFAGCLMSLLSLEAKQVLFKERLASHPAMNKHSKSMRINRASLIESSAKELQVHVTSKSFPCKVNSVSFTGEQGSGEGVTQGWWSEVSNQLMYTNFVFTTELVESATAVNIANMTVELAGGDGASETMRGIQIPSLPVLPGKNPIQVEWLGTPSSSTGPVTFKKIDAAVGGVCILSDGTKFLNPHAVWCLRFEQKVMLEDIRGSHFCFGLKPVYIRSNNMLLGCLSQICRHGFLSQH